MAESAGAWTDFGNELIARYGKLRGTQMICAITHDDPVTDCTEGGSPGTTTPLPTTTTTTPPVTCMGGPFQLFDNSNGGAVGNGGTQPSFTTGGHECCLVQIVTYHWNSGQGATAGKLGMVSVSGGLLGPWPATGSDGQATQQYPDGVPNANWTATPPGPQPTLIDGSYACYDSDPSSWSQDAASTGQGFCHVWVESASSATG